MTEPAQPETNPPPANVTNPPPADPAPRPIVVTPQPQSPALHETMQSVVNTITALPEKIVDALRESTPRAPEPPPAPATQPATNPTAPPPSTEDVRTTRQRWQDWWFGKGGK